MSTSRAKIVVTLAHGGDGGAVYGTVLDGPYKGRKAMSWWGVPPGCKPGQVWSFVFDGEETDDEELTGSVDKKIANKVESTIRTRTREILGLTESGKVDPRWERALEFAGEGDWGAGINSTLKQAASDEGIPFGKEMEAFVTWAHKQLGI